MIQIFLSSTAKDLQEYRDAVFKAIQECDGLHCIRMEDFRARAEIVDEFCRSKVAECDVFVGIIGHCFGSRSKRSRRSFTQQEYDAAVKAKRPRLIFVAPEEFPVPANLIEDDATRKRQEKFRARVKSQPCAIFPSPQVLATKVVTAIHNWESNNPKRVMRVFLCHSPQDKLIIQKLNRKLRRNNVDTWHYGDSFLRVKSTPNAIRDAVRHSQAMLICLTRNTVNRSGGLKKELRLVLNVAREESDNVIFLIPVRLEQCRIPTQLSHLQWVDLFEGDGLERLLKVLEYVPRQ